MDSLCVPLLDLRSPRDIESNLIPKRDLVLHRIRINKNRSTSSGDLSPYLELDTRGALRTSSSDQRATETTGRIFSCGFAYPAPSLAYGNSEQVFFSRDGSNQFSRVGAN